MRNMIKINEDHRCVRLIEFTDYELLNYTRAIIKIGTFIPDIECVEPPIEELGILLELCLKLKNDSP